VNVFIAVDREGISGVVSEADTDREGRAAEAARERMRGDLDAALAGCLAAGVREAVVCDAHDDGRSLDVAGLPPQVTLVGGPASPLSMVQGVETGVDAALFVGYHARAGSAAAVLEHTWNYKVFSVMVGDLEVGEIGIGALVAGHFGVPVIYVSGDDKTAAEAAALIPGVVTTAVKTGLARWSARLLPEAAARARIREDVQRAVSARDWPAPLAWNGAPLRLTFTRVQYADQAEICPGTRRLDGRTLEVGGESFLDVYRGFLACLALSEG